MPRKYEKVSEYEKEIIELYNQGMSLREIGERFGFTHKQMRDFKTRYNKKQKKIDAGIALRTKGRPAKDYEITEEMKISELKYIIARNDTKIKRLEMENELMKDFLSLTERR